MDGESIGTRGPSQIFHLKNDSRMSEKRSTGVTNGAS